MRRCVPLLVLLVSVGSSSATFGCVYDAINNVFGSLFNQRVCGSCPPVPCRAIPAINLGYCCGCRRFPIDNAPIDCAPDLICPPNKIKLCDDYDYLMDCCC